MTDFFLIFSDHAAEHLLIRNTLQYKSDLMVGDYTFYFKYLGK